MTIDPDRFAHLARISLCIADPTAAPVSKRITEAHDAGFDADTIAEVILQGIPYSGFPGAVEALGELRELVPSASIPSRQITASPHTASPHSASPDTASPDTNSSKDADPPPAFVAVYRNGSEAVRGALRARHPDLERWILDFAYGEVMGREILPLADLEGLAVASLIGQRRRTPLHSHLRGALRNGWSAEALTRLVAHLAPDGNPEVIAFARKVIEREGHTR